MPNLCVIRGSLGTIEVGTKTDAVVSVSLHGGGTLSGRPLGEGQPPPTSLVDLFEPQLEQFVRAIRFGERPVVDGREGRRSVELMEACYRTRQPWVQPWDVGQALPAAMEVVR